ncbi:MAG TPA: 23S rRNA (uracil(1939)-C(5))-methyltransferase RlmD [Desulfitobacterium dehalogenans]|uniref:23S rRNA (Uracil(1939)-C(5))-methyltransferase RlmD n=1 Tax=Desulfitobacterium dehalogenans TaxID=36854 RepID=A0A7C6Z3W0_9FIRM|nr:23S rRNA (uracil(1939)-C(5))-methyltransferase RlmD [Desulfitobacterium dehalogenans]
MNSKDRLRRDALSSRELIELECLRLSSDGSGVGYHKGKATFVTGLLPEERAQVQILEEKKNWQRGKLLSIVKETESRHRVNPPCTVYGVCGGCQLQHLSYEETLVWKKRWVEDNLARIGKIDMEKVRIHPTIGMAEPWRYRNKARLHRGEEGRLGYYQERSNATVPFTDCLLISESMNHWVKDIEKSLQEFAPEVKTLTFRENSQGEGILILDPISDLQGIRELLAGNTPWSGKGRAVWGIFEGKPELLWGKGDFTEEILGREFKISPLAFLQVNPIQTRNLYITALQYAELTPDKVVWDLYSGIGTITLALGAKAKRVWGIEENPYAVHDAKLNAELNDMDNVKFLAGKVEDTLSQISDSPDIVVLDPPRAGAHPRVLEELIELQPPRIVYVSCDPGTLARDLGILQNGGYQVREVQPIDMFPWTNHVETVCLLSSKINGFRQ